jgi:hypothetical protein
MQQAFFSQRNKECEELWGWVRRFYVPAWSLPLKTLQEIGCRLIRTQPELQAVSRPATAGMMAPVTLAVSDAKKLLEFFVLTIEARREDKLKALNFRVTVSEPELWVLPVDDDLRGA